MGYFDSLSKMVKESGLTLKEIADKCGDYGVNINPSYISKLQTTRQAPASDEVNIALAKVCKADVDNFRYEAFIEKSPEFLKDFIDKNLRIIRKMSEFYIDTNYENDIPSSISEKTKNFSDYEMVNFIYEEYLLLSHLETDYEAALETKETIKMFDDSMEPRIPKDTLLTVDDSEVNNGDIVFVILTDGSFLIRKYIEIQQKDFTNKIGLISENRWYSSSTIDKHEIKTLRKVKSMTLPI
ncbi:S24 family peptidase [Paenibacillus sp. GCM10012307]|uniref:LexA family transcriptional regulator n=1 Tax=Paenibacillus roseus TaxID=2798579 RepID=A0A934J450_9BACL|nr:LexA family transcriptional regulator [Paenibacillus roseus]MBJ6361309.1 LexA family transcriptional regulator [Paenibacillus roseus]